jgi:hypothetical protein
MKPPNWRHDHSRGYWAKEDRLDAIIGKYGSVTDDGNGRIGWFLALETRRAMTAKLKKLVALGATVDQEGDLEAGGQAPVELVDRVVKIIGVYRKPKRCARSPSWGRQMARKRHRGPVGPQESALQPEPPSPAHESGPDERGPDRGSDPAMRDPRTHGQGWRRRDGRLRSRHSTD